jgi:hypothetical protein
VLPALVISPHRSLRRTLVLHQFYSAVGNSFFI